MESRPLIADLDGSVIASDLLLESFLRLLRQRPWAVLCLPFWLLRGRAVLKQKIAERGAPDMVVMPRRVAVIDFLRAEKARGRRVLLATASHRQLAERFADSCDGLFDEVLATEGGVNLKSGRKAALLVQRFGEGGFDYIGNDAADRAVWRRAHTVHVVNASEGFARQALQLGQQAGQWFPVQRLHWRTLLKALRVHQWLKNVLVFVPLLAAHHFSDWPLLAAAVLAFVVFSLCASSVYLLNDMLDLDDDRHHRSKCRRPMASGAMSILWGLALVPLLLLTSVTLAVLFLPLVFVAVLAVYYALTLMYSFWLKRLLFIDVVILASLYTIRVIGGAVAVAVELSFWLAAFSVFVFLSLAIVKRYTELLLLQEQGDVLMKGRGYHVEDMPLLLSFGIASGYLSVLVMALYINSENITGLYAYPVLLWLLCPLMLYWISRVWIVTHRGNMHDDPIVFAITDRVSRYTVACMALILLAAL